MAYIELEKSLMEEKDLMQKMGAKAFKAIAQRRADKVKEENELKLNEKYGIKGSNLLKLS